ncbi:hypothetical protein G4B88_003605 [Cannabis sativa]|uniref:Uncharacterized protein n=1 Tax=Cannabis sativa TaxID=3483 RepID=A0A7J6FB47_CANSA|nr:hypothetical protein G4B88_003605 [Cannabis sativa]
MDLTLVSPMIRCLSFCLGNWVLTTDVGEGKRSLISEDRDSGVGFEMHFKLLKEFLKDLASLKRANDLC